MRAVEEYKGRQWRLVARNLPNRSSVQCRHRYASLQVTHKGPWTAEVCSRPFALLSSSFHVFFLVALAVGNGNFFLRRVLRCVGVVHCAPSGGSKID